MVDKDSYPLYLILGLIVAVYCSHAFGIRPLAQNYHLVKPELVPWHQQTTPSEWYGYALEFGDGPSVSKWPSCWDFFVELIVFLSGGVLLESFRSKAGGRNISAIIRAIGCAAGLIAIGVIVESIGNSKSVVPLNSLFIILGILHFVGSVCLLLPIQRIRVLVGVSVLCILTHWGLLQFVVGTHHPVETVNAGETQPVQTETIPKTVWDNESGVTAKVSEFLESSLPMSVRKSGLSSDFQNYNPLNIVAYLGLSFAGMVSLQILKNKRFSHSVISFVSLSLLCISVSLSLAYLGIPAVPRLASPTHVLMAAGFSFGLFSIATVLTQSAKLRLLFTPWVALGLCSALVYLLERILGNGLRTEAAKHLEQLLKPLFDEGWLRWEPIVFYNLVFLSFVVLAMYCYKRKVRFSF